MLMYAAARSLPAEYSAFSASLLSLLTYAAARRIPQSIQLSVHCLVSLLKCADEWLNGRACYAC